MNKVMFLIYAYQFQTISRYCLIYSLFSFTMAENKFQHALFSRWHSFVHLTKMFIKSSPSLLIFFRTSLSFVTHLQLVFCKLFIHTVHGCCCSLAEYFLDRHSYSHCLWRHKPTPPHLSRSHSKYIPNSEVTQPSWQEALLCKAIFSLQSDTIVLWLKHLDWQLGRGRVTWLVGSLTKRCLYTKQAG